jgi:hypothetical protein
MMLAVTESDNLLAHTSLYQEFLAERDEILKHKWIESEKAGHDIGFERAHTDWIVKHRAGWLRWRRSQRNQTNPQRVPGRDDRRDGAGDNDSDNPTGPQ